MPDSDLLEIIRSCINLDMTAYKTYVSMSQTVADNRLKAFWSEMAAEEKEHASYWTTALTLAEENRIPQLFDDPPKIKAELHAIEDRIEELLKAKFDSRNVTDMFLLACRMEFFMNHSTFQILLEFVNSLDRKRNIENYYDQHINKFVDALSTFGASSPALEVLGEALNHLRTENKTLSAQSGLDELTGIRNRRSFLDIMHKFGSLAKRNRFSVGVMMADIDHFKNVNDTYGHVQGDQVLKRIAHVIQANLRPSDIVGRYGGEEFIAYLSQLDHQDALLVGEKIRKAVEREGIDGMNVTVSIGMCCGTLPMEDDVTETLSEYMRAADACLYQAKTAGRNRVIATSWKGR